MQRLGGEGLLGVGRTDSSSESEQGGLNGHEKNFFFLFKSVVCQLWSFCKESFDLSANLGM